MHRKIGALGQKLAQQPIGVLARAPLPGTVRVAEVHPHARCLGQLPVPGHFLALIVGQRLAQRLCNQVELGRKRRQRALSRGIGQPFAQMRHMGGKLIRTIGQARATAAMTMKAVCYNIQRLARFLEDGVDAFYKTASPSKSVVRLQGGNA